MARVKEMMLEGYERSDIVAEFPKLATRTVDRYIAAVHEQRRRDAEIAKPHEIQSSIARLVELSRKAERAEHWSGVARFERMLMDIRGLSAPEDHKHVHLHAAAPAEAAPVKSADELLQVLEPSDEELAALQALASRAVQKRLSASSTVVEGEVVKDGA